MKTEMNLPNVIVEKLKFHAKLNRATPSEIAVQAIMAYDFNVMCNSKERTTQGKGKL